MLFSTSFDNPEEAEFVIQLCIHLSTLMSPEKASQNIGIITPYQSQRSLIVDLLKQRSAPSSLPTALFFHEF